MIGAITQKEFKMKLCKKNVWSLLLISVSLTAGEVLFSPPDEQTIPAGKTGDLIRYGKELVTNFPYYLGPKGKVGHFGGNGLGCNNCHLDSGRRPYGLNYFSVHARYPQYRGREGKFLTLSQRVNNCIERPLNGKKMPLDSKEMLAIVSYMKWLGTGVPTGAHVPGDELKEITLPNRAADLNNGKVVYENYCASCHGKNGEGQIKPDGIAYTYPPLWGYMSYQPGSSMHRVIKAAQFIKYNMPLGVTWENPILTDEQAIDVAAYINDDHRKRPKPNLTKEYPYIEDRPVSYHMGPYPDPFSQEEHKFGDYNPIIQWRKEHNVTTTY